MALNNMFEIFSYDFMIRAFEAGLLLALVAPTIGIFFVVRHYAVMADTLAHVSLAGIAGGLFLGISSVWAALLACVLAILGIEHIREQRRISSDTVVALFLFGGLALGVILMNLHPSAGVNVANYLFGSILTVTSTSVFSIAVIAALTLFIAWIGRQTFFAISLDEDVARAVGLPVRFFNRLLAILGAATIAISIHVVGVLLIGALMVIPVLTAMQLRRGFKATWFVALLVSLLSVCFGLTISYYLNVASGAMIVLCAIGCFLLTTIFSRWTGRFS